jgi:hypothetical protein
VVEPLVAAIHIDRVVFGVVLPLPRGLPRKQVVQKVFAARGERSVSIEHALADRTASACRRICLQPARRGCHQCLAAHFAAHFGAHLAAHLLAAHLAFMLCFMWWCFLALHVAAHFAPHLAMLAAGLGGLGSTHAGCSGGQGNDSGGQGSQRG